MHHCCLAQIYAFWINDFPLRCSLFGVWYDIFIFKLALYGEADCNLLNHLENDQVWLIICLSLPKSGINHKNWSLLLPPQ